MPEVEWMVARTKLYELRQERPNASVKELALEVGYSERWVRKWLKRFAEHEGEATKMFCSHSRAPHHHPKRIQPKVVEAILDIRDNPPEGLKRIPGPKAILYYLSRHEQIKEEGYYLPTSTHTIWLILNENGRIHRHEPHQRQVEPLSEPMADWQMDFKTISSVPAAEDGKKQHVVESLNIVDKGTSIAIGAVPRGDYHAQTVLTTLLDIFMRQGMPQTITFDRDPRFVGSWTANEFPSALMRFFLAIGIRPIVCPPQRPQKNAYVERFNGSYKRECLLIHQPNNIADVIECTANYLTHYNNQRPHQGRACQNKPPRLAFPTARPPQKLPEVADPDRWLTFASRRLYKRRVTTNGTICMGNHSYYVSQKLAKQRVAVRVKPQEKALAILTGTECVKTIPIKGLYEGQLELADYVELMSVEVLSESRRLAVKRRQRRRQQR